MVRCILILSLSAVLSGCWSFNASERPSVSVARPQGAAADLLVGVNGFAAVVTQYETVFGYSTFYVPSCHDRWHCCFGGHYQTVSTQTVIPRVMTTDVFLKRARETLEDAGFRLASATPDLTVEVTFGGPVVSGGDVAKQWGLRLGTVFFCDYAAETWTATMRIRDNRTGRLLLKRDYEQRFQTNAAGLLPIFGIAACEETSAAYMQSWCLSALTDRATADAAAFLNQNGETKK